ncbi:MAG: HDOD domain-containing protein [Thermodesulfobacteriota bacterium]
MDDTTRETFARSLRQIKNLPTLPGIVGKLTAMAEDPRTTSEQMGRLIAKDHILAAKLLKLVNSSFYGFPQRISSLSGAIILLGFNVIKSLIISASIFELMESQDVDLWEHSLGCAVCCSVLAKRLGIPDPEEVSTAGLIHDIGKVAIKMELPGQHEQITAMVAGRGCSRLEAERQLLHLDHAEAGGWLAKSWNLPVKLIEPVAHHHQPDLAKQEPLTTAVVHCSDVITRALGHGHGRDVWVPRLDEGAWRLLALPMADLDQLLDEIEEKLWDVKGFSLQLKAGIGTSLTEGAQPC